MTKLYNITYITAENNYYAELNIRADKATKDAIKKNFKQF